MIFLMILSVFVGCEKEEVPTHKEEYGILAFAFDKSELDERSLKASEGYSLDNVSAAVVTIEKDGVALESYNSKQIALNNWGTGVYTTEDVQLLVGADYSLTKFELKNAEGTVIYAIPLAGSELADKVEKPLPITFAITKDESTPVNVEVISTEEREVAQFGYVQFVVTDKTDNGSNTVVEGEMIDSRDGQTYKTVTIGNQVWMAENLAYLPSVNTLDDISDTDPFYYVYNYEGDNVNAAKAHSSYNSFGVLYNGAAALQVAPEGWHLPTDEEWKELEMTLGMSQEDADATDWRGAIAPQLKSTEGWDDYYEEPGNGTNETGFNILSGGAMSGLSRRFDDIGKRTYMWTSSKDINRPGVNVLYYRQLAYYYDGVDRYTAGMQSAFYVRLVKDK